VQRRLALPQQCPAEHELIGVVPTELIHGRFLSWGIGKHGYGRFLSWGIGKHGYGRFLS
jgi:hypothetical protein